MKTYTHSFTTCIHTKAQRQQGVILFVTLISLVVLMISGLALVRTVDSTVLIAGNLAFKQSATASADGGVYDAMQRLKQLSDDNKLDADNKAVGYHASLVSPATLSLAHGGNAWTPGTNSSPEPLLADVAGNKTSFVIQRMARAVGVCTEDSCLAAPGGGGKTPDKTVGKDPPLNPGGGDAALYRITVRSTGPRGTTSYVQVFAS